MALVLLKKKKNEEKKRDQRRLLWRMLYAKEKHMQRSLSKAVVRMNPSFSIPHCAKITTLRK